MKLDAIRTRMFTEAELAQQVRPVPAEIAAANDLYGDAGQVEEASVGFVHGTISSTAYASSAALPALGAIATL